MAASSSSSSSSYSTICYDVFLSFRGKDTRKNFTSHLYHALSSKGINTLIDNELQRGEEISDSLVKAIEGSRLSIVIFSSDYASSTYCLNELVNILECKVRKGQVVLPIFYKVDPTDVQQVRGTYGVALNKHEADGFEDNLHKWRFALVHVSNLAGLVYFDDESNQEDEATFIDRIIEVVSDKLDRKSLEVAAHPIGLDSHIQCIESMLNVGSSDVRMVGIWGMGGTGKTTLAKAIYNRFARQFEASSFLPNVRERSSEPDGIVKLQEAILHDTTGFRQPLMGNFERGIILINERLKSKRVFIVIDDVDRGDQLEKLVGGVGKGSRIIITTRDRTLLDMQRLVKVIESYKMSQLCNKDALELFIWNAFGKHQIDKDYVQLSRRVVEYAQGLPLALILLGKSLIHRGMSYWEDMLAELSQSPPKDISKILRISYDGLENQEQKKIFLDIACFFKGMDKDEILDIFDAFRYKSRLGVEILIERSLLYVEGNKIQMHDLLQTMGRYIASCPNNGAGGRRLCFQEHIIFEEYFLSLSESEIMSDIEGIRLDFPEEEVVEMNANAFEKMTRFKIFIIRNALFTEAPKLPPLLKYLHWDGYNFESMAPEFIPTRLVKLEMPRSNIMQFGQAFTSKRKFINLMQMNFSGCSFLKDTPNFSAIPNLKELVLSQCKSIKGIDESIRCLEKLQILDVSGCTKLTSFPNLSKSANHEKKLMNLRGMNFCGCGSLKEIPDFSAIPNLETLDLVRCVNLERIDESIGCLEKLSILRLDGCSILRRCPSFIKLKSLVGFSLSGCSKLEKFPNIMETMTGLRALQLIDTAIDEVPSSFEHLPLLADLVIQDWPNLVNVSNIYKLQYLNGLFISNCPKLGNFPTLDQVQVVLPSSASCGLFPRLMWLQIRKCNLVQVDFLKTPNCFQNLIMLELSWNNLIEVDFLQTPEDLPILQKLVLSGNNIFCIPTSIFRLSNLIHLEVKDCMQLVEIPELPPSLKILDASNCESLERFPQLTSLRGSQRFYLFNCHKLMKNMEKHWMYAILQNVSNNVSNIPTKAVLGDGFLEWAPQSKYGEWIEKKKNLNRISCIAFPGDDEWAQMQKYGDLPGFNYASESGQYSLSFQIPGELINDSFNGIAFYFIFTFPASVQIGRKEFFHISVNDGDPFTCYYELPCEFETNHMWLAFFGSPALDLPMSLPHDQKVSFKFSTRNNNIKCKKCGAHLIYKMN